MTFTSLSLIFVRTVLSSNASFIFSHQYETTTFEIVIGLAISLLSGLIQAMKKTLASGKGSFLTHLQIDEPIYFLQMHLKAIHLLRSNRESFARCGQEIVLKLIKNIQKASDSFQQLLYPGPENP